MGSLQTTLMVVSGNSGKKLFCKETALLNRNGCVAGMQQNTEICVPDGSCQKYSCCSIQMGVLGFVVFSNGVHPLLCFKMWHCLPLLLSICDARRVPLFPQLKIVDFAVVDGS